MSVHLGIKLLHDDARLHETKLVKPELERMGIVKQRRHPYSPDVTSKDFWLFASLQNDLAGKHFKIELT